jgi:hypothetical protein
LSKYIEQFLKISVWENAKEKCKISYPIINAIIKNPAVPEEHK